MLTITLCNVTKLHYGNIILIHYHHNTLILYTNIPHTEGISAINKMMEETGTDTILKMFISNLTHQVFTKNYFQFNDKLYEQKQGTAMGTRMAPNYVIIFMHYLETNFLTSYQKQPKNLVKIHRWYIYDMERWRTTTKKVSRSPK